MKVTKQLPLKLWVDEGGSPGPNALTVVLCSFYGCCGCSPDAAEGDFNSEKQKHGQGVYSWMEPDEESGEAKKVASYEGKYTDGKKNGLGKMVFPNGDVYFGEWKDNKVG